MFKGVFYLCCCIVSAWEDVIQMIQGPPAQQKNQNMNNDNDDDDNLWKYLQIVPVYTTDMRAGPV